MSSERWSDRELRTFVLRAQRLSWSDNDTADLERRAFGDQFIGRIAHGVQARVLAEAGVPVSAEGLAVLACELLEGYADSKKRDWLLVCVEPWPYLEQWITEFVIKTYRATVGRAPRDAKVLDGISAASGRRAVESGDAE